MEMDREQRKGKSGYIANRKVFSKKATERKSEKEISQHKCCEVLLCLIYVDLMVCDSS